MKSRACRKNLTRVSAFIDNELSPVERRRLEAHLAVCPGCSRYLEELRAGSALLKSLPAVEPRQEAISELKARLRMTAHIGEENVCEMMPVRLSAYIDNELPGPERQLVEQHLAVCPDCSRYLEELRAISRHLNLLPEIEPSRAAVESLKAKVRSAHMPVRRSSAPVFAFPRFAHARLGLAAAAVVLLAVALYVFSPFEHGGNMAGTSVKPTSFGGAARDMADADLKTGKDRLLAELALNEGGKAQSATGSRDSLEVFDPAQSDTRGRIVHSIVFGERRATRAPVASHVLFVSYGD
ncbi:MAG TPA: zf-HC2 domain-containing protein [bacterium]|nr:zf-HC2 domain-containing protein [bacterium]